MVRRLKESETPKKKPGPTSKLTASLAETIRLEYVHGVDAPNGQRVYPTIAGLANKHKVPRQTLTKRSSKGDWIKAREEYQEQLRIDLEAAKRKSIIDQSVDFDVTTFNIVRQLQNEIIDALNKSIEYTNDIREGRRQLPEGHSMSEMPELYRHLSNSGIGQLAHNLDLTQRMGRLITGESTENIDVSDSSKIQNAIEGIFEIIDNAADADGRFDGHQPLRNIS